MHLPPQHHILHLWGHVSRVLSFYTCCTPQAAGRIARHGILPRTPRSLVNWNTYQSLLRICAFETARLRLPRGTFWLEEGAGHYDCAFA